MIKEQKHAFDPTMLALLFSNLLTIVFAVWQGWGLFALILVYWCQSAIIGFFNFLRILSLKNPIYQANFKEPPKPVSTSGKISDALFFAFHYGFFHFGYLIFIISFWQGSAEIGNVASFFDDALTYLLLIAVYFANHLYSYLKNKLPEKTKINHLFAYPYLRILPMHLTIVLFGSVLMGFEKNTFILVFFMLLKTIADAGMHWAEHNVLYKK